MSSHQTTIYEAGQAFHLENWPAALRALSMPGIQLELSPAEHQAMLTAYALRDDPESADSDQAASTRIPLALLRVRLDDAIARLGGVAFVKLGSRSPKDSWWGLRHGFACYRGTGALRLLLDSTERIADDLGGAKAAGMMPSLWVREWVSIPRWAEFRCLIEQRRLIGISQYDYLAGELAELIGNTEQIRKAVTNFTAKAISALHVDSAVVDIAFRDGALDKPLLVETNPFDHYTDPCLFEDDNPILGKAIADTAMPSFRYLGDGRAYRHARQRSKAAIANHLALPPVA